MKVACYSQSDDKPNLICLKSGLDHIKTRNICSNLTLAMHDKTGEKNIFIVKSHFFIKHHNAAVLIFNTTNARLGVSIEYHTA